MSDVPTAQDILDNDVIADLFDLDLRIDVVTEQQSGRCSAECTNDGCTRPSKC